MKNLKEKAEIYRRGLAIGLFSKDEIIKWVDSVIENENDFDYAFIEVSLNSNKSIEDIVHILKNIKGNVDSKKVVNIVIGILSKRFHENVDLATEIANMLYKLTQHVDKQIIDIRSANKIRSINEGFYLAEQNIYGYLKDMILELKDFLNDYRKYENVFSVL